MLLLLLIIGIAYAAIGFSYFLRLVYAQTYAIARSAEVDSPESKRLAIKYEREWAEYEKKKAEALKQAKSQYQTPEYRRKSSCG